MTSESLNKELDRLASVASALAERSDDLNDLIEVLTDKIVASGVGVAAWVDSYAMTGWKFGFCRIEGEWLLAAKQGRYAPIPLIYAPRKLRMAAMRHMDELIRVLADRTAEFLQDVEASARIVEELIGRPQESAAAA